LLKNEFEVEKIFLQNYDINPCKECYYCMDKDECAIKDDMQRLYPKLKEAKVIILSSPIFMGGLSAILRTFMERTWHLRKGQLSGKIGSYIIVGRRNLGVGISEAEEYFSRLKMYKIAGVFGFGLWQGDVATDEEAMNNIKVLSNQIINLSKKLDI